MTDIQQDESEYLGYRIWVRCGPTADDPFVLLAAAWVNQSQPTGLAEPTFTEILNTVFKGTQNWPKSDDGAIKALMQQALHRARGAILLDRIEELEGQEFSANEQEPCAQRSDEYLRALVLGAFKRVYRYDPSQRGHIDFDDIGVALVEGIDPKDVEYILDRLQDDGLIEVAGAGHKPGYRLYQPTAAGLAQADRLSSSDLAPGLLVEETVSEIERRLARHAPDLVRRFRELFLKVVEPRQLTHLDVGEIAQTCDLLLQEFLDLPIIWEGVTEERPPRDKTKDRLSVILRARVSSETEEALITGLGDYLFGWFGPLDKFVNKYRHPLNPDLSQRLHAKRLVVYTYLLVGDLVELLDM